MKFIVNSISLLKSVQALGGVLNAKNTLPILDNFLFELEGNTLSVTASDLETIMTVSIELEMAGENGKLAVPARLLMDTLKTFPNVPVSFTISDDFKIEMAAGEGKYKLTGFAADDFPQLPKMEDVSEVGIQSDILLTAINKTIFATGTDELRPVMGGVFCDFHENDVVFVATDAHKLVRYKRNGVQAGAELSFILPKKPLNLLRSTLVDDEVEIKIEYSEKNAVFHFDNYRLVCKLVEGRYPNYDAVIPKENPNVLTVDRQSFLSVVRRVSIFANKSTHQIRLNITGQELLLSAEDLDYSNDAKERLSCSYVGEDMSIGFNSRFLIEMLSNLDSEEVNIHMSQPNRAGLIIPSNSNEQEDILMLIMPVMLNG
ncbi:MAG: DNA polymerase III subunit beta [Bacteroidetes bacterium 4572_77]|nr:MAG: DNA polymerase III subunit beta [Bacteroidetes bacterium 4572_77]